jgi:hypothetical protein
VQHDTPVGNLFQLSTVYIAYSTKQFLVPTSSDKIVMSLEKHPNKNSWRLRVRGKNCKVYGRKDYSTGFMYNSEKEATTDADLFRWYCQKAEYLPGTFSKPLQGRFDWKSKPVGEEWEIIRSEKPWNTESAAVDANDANDANDDGGDLAVQDNDVQNQDLNMHKSYCKYGITKKRAICKVVKETMTTTFSSISGSWVEDLPEIVADIYGLSPSKKMRSGDAMVDELAGQSVSSAHCKALERKDSNTALQLGSLLMGAGITRKDIQKAHPDCLMSSRQFTGSKQHAKRVGPGVPVPYSRPTARNLDHRARVILALVSFCIREGLTTASARTVRCDSGERIAVPLLHRKHAVDYLLDRFIRIQEIGHDIPAASKDAPRSKKGERMYTGLRRADMRQAIKTVCPSILKSLAALDTTSETSGRCVNIAICC